MGAFVHRSALLVIALFIGGLATAAPTRAEVNEVRIGFGYGLVYLTRMVAEEQRYFAAQAKKTGAGNFVVSTRRLSGPPALNDALSLGNIDVGAVGTPGFLILWSKTKGHQDRNALAALAAHVFVVFTNQSRIKSIADFGEQDKIAMPAPTSPQGILVRMAAEQIFGTGRFAHVETA
jgi:NitT/TauT family transport system substrate-binding protein